MLHSIEKLCVKWKKGNESSKTLVAFYNLSWRGGVDLDEDGAVALLEDV